MRQLIASVGDVFGRLTVIRDVYQRRIPRNKRVYTERWVSCQCVCGVEKDVRIDQLFNGTVSCGCYAQEKVTKHSSAGTPLYQCWINMRQRCTNPNSEAYKHYGGRGIVVCDEWQRFEAFQQWATRSGYTSDLTIHRVNNDLGYFPRNCCWIPKHENTRRKYDLRVLGASWNKRLRKWQARIMVSGREYWLGLFDARKSAIDAYRKVAAQFDVLVEAGV